MLSKNVVFQNILIYLYYFLHEFCLRDRVNDLTKIESNDRRKQVGVNYNKVLGTFRPCISVP